METDFTIQAPHTEAAEMIRDKPVVSKEVFKGLLPELRGRAFAVSGVEGALVLRRVRDAIAGIAEGENWDDAKAIVVDELDPFLGEGASNRAELLLRTHGFTAFQAANWRVAQEDEDTTHLQYLATEDDRVRDTHLALNGLVLPKNDPFWQDHYPPWEWNCRCRVRPMNPDLVDEERSADKDRNPEDKNVIEGPALEQLRNGTLLRNGQRFDVTAPKDGPEGESAFQWNPDDLRLPLSELKDRYDEETFDDFRQWALGMTGSGGTSLWEYLASRRKPPIEKRLGQPVGLTGTAKELLLENVERMPGSGEGLARMDGGTAQEILRRGLQVNSDSGFSVRFGEIAERHFRTTQAQDARARFLPAARRVVEEPAEVWEYGQRHYFIGRFYRNRPGQSGFVVIAARKGEGLDEVITWMPKTNAELEKLRKGRLVYRKEIQ